MSLTDAVAKLSDYLNQSIKTANNAAAASSKRATVAPDGLLKTSLERQTSANTLNSLKQNPIINTAVDTANQAVTSVAQQVVKNAIKKVNFTPIQNASQQFFTLFASVTSFGVEVAMELARNTGRNLIKALQEKDAIALKLEGQMNALYNACAILLNGQPFFDTYLKNIIKAYGLIESADLKLKRVSSVLASQRPRYLSRTFSESITQLTQASELILPDRGVDVSSISSTADFVSSTLNRQSNQQVFAAAVSIPGITLEIGKLVLQYEVASINVNAYMNAFVNALDDYISNYQQSKSVNQATIDHINAGTSRIDELLAEMAAILSQNSGLSTDVQFRAKLSSYATIWGVTLTGIIEWLKLNPGAGSALLSQTSASVEAYNKARAKILSVSDTPYPGGTIYYTEGREDAFKGLVRLVARALTTANTIVATSSTKNDIRAQCSAVKNYCATSRKVDTQLIASIQTFVNTKTTLTGDVAKGLKQLTAFANKTGLDRMAGLLTNGNVKDLFSATPETSTYAGAAVVGINSIITNLKELPGATTQQISQMENLRDQVSREQKAREVFAGRSAQSTEDEEAAQRQKAVDTDKTLVQTATETAKQLDAEVADDPVAKTQTLINAKVTPNQMPNASDVKAAL